MTKVVLIGPLDQPLGNRRLLSELKDALSQKNFSELLLAVAFAKSGPLLRMQSQLLAWRAAGSKTQAVFGIDHKGTSQQALSIALNLFDSVYITREPGFTFHPKLYLFHGPKSARCFIGSNNLTVGGTETNFEMSVRLDLELPVDAELFESLRSKWKELLPETCAATKKLDQNALEELVSQGLVLDENVMNRRGDSELGLPTGKGKWSKPSGLSVKPPSPLPRSSVDTNTLKSKLSKKAGPGHDSSRGINAAAEGFAIQIRPHHNGEIFLSVTAALQNPGFFEWPFTGSTIPKKSGNPSYPQRTPDPIVSIKVYGPRSTLIYSNDSYSLNTVYYANKSEIRVTASPLVGVVPDYSIMIMQKGTDPHVDYNIVIYTPDSPQYKKWVKACNQTMPGGGKMPRKFGWF